MKYYFIVNPLSNIAKKNKIPLIEKFCNEKKADFSIKYSKFSGHITEIVKNILKDFKNEKKTLIAIGGDGSLNELCRGIIESECNKDNILVGIIPSGTANVMAKELKIPEELNSALETIFNGKVKKIYPGKADDNFFLFTCGIGFDALVVHNVNTEWKKKVGKFSYVTTGMAVLNQIPNLPYFSLTVDNNDFTAQSIIINKSRKYAGDYNLFRNVSLTDNFFEVLIFNKITIWDNLSFWVKMKMNKFKPYKNAFYVRGKKIIIKSKVQIPAQVDGDKLNELPNNIKVMNTQIPILVPFSI